MNIERRKREEQINNNNNNNNKHHTMTVHAITLCGQNIVKSLKFNSNRTLLYKVVTCRWIANLKRFYCLLEELP